MIKTLRELQQAQPFVPFVVHLADGRTLAIPHPDFIWIPRGEGRVYISDSKADRVHHLNPLVIVSVTESPSEKAEK